jgi:diguanylate cyclase (GGDEF)-like protein
MRDAVHIDIDLENTQPPALPAEPTVNRRWAATSNRAPDDAEDSAVIAMTATAPDEDVSDVIIMMVDDDPVITETVSVYLEEAGYKRFLTVNDPREALAAAQAHRPGLLLLDLMMPGLSGFQVLEQFRADESLRYLPVIMLTASSDASAKIRALELGANEFLSKPVDATELMLRVRNTLKLRVFQNHLIRTDLLTGLPNRTVFVSLLGSSLVKARRDGSAFALLQVNLDRFRKVNDSYGQDAGDRVLKVVARRLAWCAQEGQRAPGHEDDHEAITVARLGGDEFALLVPNLSNPEVAGRLARRVLAAMSAPINENGQDLFVTPSIGVALFPGDGESTEALLRHASVAMEHAKASGRNTFQFYSADINTVSLERTLLENQLRRAGERGQFSLVYQPKVNLRNNRIVGAEALLRWQHPELGSVSPERFMPIAEETGLIVELGSWIIRSACAQLARWRLEGLGLKLAVNVSRHELVAGGLVDCVRNAMREYGIGPGELMLELTESMLMDRVETTVLVLAELRAMGVELCIDDFGTGYSSMGYLKRFLLDELKIDKSFVERTPTHITDVAIVHAMITLGHSLGMRVVAEGVENEQQRATLADLSCDIYQGYLCSQALPAEAFTAKVREFNLAAEAA